MNKNLLLGIFGNVAPEGKIIKYMSSEAVRGGWVNNNTDTSRNTFVNGKGTLYLNDGVTTIGGYHDERYSPFYHNQTVISVDLSESNLTSISSDAFSSCSKLTSIIISDSVTSIHIYTFNDCYELQSIIIDENNPVYDSRGNCNAIIETATKKIITGCKGTVIPNDVTAIGSLAFNGSGLTSITIPSNVISIDTEAFFNCKLLNSISVDSGNLIYDSRDDCNAIIETSSNILLYGCQSTIIPNTVTSVTSYAFNGSELMSIIIPNNIISIDSYAFFNCQNLTSVTCKAVTPPTLGTNNFTASNDTLYVPAESVETYQNSETWNTAFTNIEAMPPMILYKSSQAVSGGWVTNNTDTNRNTYDSITREGVLYLNPNVSTIGGGWSTDYSPFYNNSNVTEIDLSLSCLTSIGECAFYDCSGLESITIPDNVTSIGNNVFYECYNLTSIIIPDSVTSIGYFAFSYCSGLTSMVVDSNNTTYDSRNNCNAIIATSTNTLIVGCQNTVIPNDVTSIGDDAFLGCTDLTSITIPNDVTSIGYGSFGSCSGLSSVTCLATTPPTLGSNNFTASDDILYVPSESVSAYESDTNWSAAFTTITAI